VEPYIPIEFQNHDLVKTAKVFFLYSPGLDNGWGWALPVYYDITSAVYRVFNCPTYATTYEMSKMPQDGDLEIELETPWKYASDAFTNVMKVNVR
jgi:hypothetical protein